jgi:hypothetical protein
MGQYNDYRSIVVPTNLSTRRIVNARYKNVYILPDYLLTR